MINLRLPRSVILVALLATLMLVTRSPQIPLPGFIPEASWAVFFALGCYRLGGGVFTGFIALAFASDALAVGWGGISAACFTPAYAMLLPAYGCLWAAGRWYALHHRPHGSTLVPLTVSALIGALSCELFSSGGYYLFSGVFTEPGWIEFANREVRYLPAYLLSLGFWLVAGVAGHLLVLQTGGGSNAAQQPAR